MLDYTQRVKQNAHTAEDYLSRPSKKHNAEMQLIRRALKKAQPPTTILDAPCGVGRATILLASLGYDATGLDLGVGAVEVADRELKKSGQKGRIVQGNLTSLDYDDASFDAILCFRLYHHFPNNETRDAIVTELCRVAKDTVLISYFSPYSVTSIKRKVRTKLGLGQGRSIQFATSLKSLVEKFSTEGFALKADVPQRRFLHTLHLAVFERA